MNKYFNIERFWKILTYELRRFQSNVLLSGVICMLMPLVIFALFQFISIMTGGSMSSSMANSYGPIGMGIAYLVSIIAFPTKLYGGLTDKRQGSDYLMIPASTLEKTAAIICTTCIILPAVMACGIGLTDSILSLVAEKYYGKTMLGNYGWLFDAFSRETNGIVNIRFGSMLYIDYVINILIFTFGAIYFKTSKPAKTILAIMVLGMALGSVFSMVAFSFGNTITAFLESLRDVDQATAEHYITNGIGYINIGLSLWYTLAIGGMTCAIYFRLKNLKH